MTSVYPSVTGYASAKAIACSFSIHLRVGSNEQNGQEDFTASVHSMNSSSECAAFRSPKRAEGTLPRARYLTQWREHERSKQRISSRHRANASTREIHANSCSNLRHKPARGVSVQLREGGPRGVPSVTSMFR